MRNLTGRLSNWQAGEYRALSGAVGKDLSPRGYGFARVCFDFELTTRFEENFGPMSGTEFADREARETKMPF